MPCESGFFVNEGEDSRQRSMGVRINGVSNARLGGGHTRGGPPCFRALWLMSESRKPLGPWGSTTATERRYCG